MKNINTTPEKRKFRPFRLVIACALIALLLASTSIGMSYARFKNEAANTDKVTFTDTNFAHADNVVIKYIDRADLTAPTVLDYNNGAVKVTVPRGLGAEDTAIAYALTVKNYSPAAYDIATGKYKTSAAIELSGLTYPDSGIVSKVNVESASGKNIDLKLAAPSAVSAESDHPEWDITADPEYNYVGFTTVPSLGADGNGVIVNVSYAKSSWSDNADSSWYDPADPQTEYEITKATELALSSATTSAFTVKAARAISANGRPSAPRIILSGVTLTVTTRPSPDLLSAALTKQNMSVSSAL